MGDEITLGYYFDKKGAIQFQFAKKNLILKALL